MLRSERGLRRRDQRVGEKPEENNTLEAIDESMSKREGIINRVIWLCRAVLKGLKHWHSHSGRQYDYSQIIKRPGGPAIPLLSIQKMKPPI